MQSSCLRPWSHPFSNLVALPGKRPPSQNRCALPVALHAPTLLGSWIRPACLKLPSTCNIGSCPCSWSIPLQWLSLQGQRPGHGSQSLPFSTQPPTLSLFLLDSTIITSNSMCLKQGVQEETFSGQKDAPVGQTRCETQESGGVCTELEGHFPELNGQWLLPLS